jgi:hypothetical protein
MQDSFLSLRMNKCMERVNDRHLESWSLQLRNDTKMSPNSRIFFFIVTSIVYGPDRG